MIISELKKGILVFIWNQFVLLLLCELIRIPILWICHSLSAGKLVTSTKPIWRKQSPRLDILKVAHPCPPFAHHFPTTQDPKRWTKSDIQSCQIRFHLLCKLHLKAQTEKLRGVVDLQVLCIQSLKPQLDRPNFMPVKYLNYNWIHLFIDINYLKICVANCLTLTMRSTNGFHLFLFCGWSWRNHFVLITSVGQPNFMDASQIFEIHQDQLNFWT